MALRGRHLFEKRLSSPHPIFQKLPEELLLSSPIKTIPAFERSFISMVLSFILQLFQSCRGIFFAVQQIGIFIPHITIHHDRIYLPVQSFSAKFKIILIFLSNPVENKTF